MRGLRRGLVVLGAAGFAAGGIAAPIHAAVSASDAVSALNQQRKAHGLPAKVKTNAQHSAWCQKHIDYMQANGGDLTHEERKGRPKYSSEGERAAGGSVLSYGASWADGNPWETAPIHLNQTLSPRIRSLGVAEDGRYVCATTLLDRKSKGPKKARIYTYPGDGVKGFYFREQALEGPYAPGERVGIKRGTITGPYLHVFADGPWGVYQEARIRSASVREPDGDKVEIKKVDNRTSGLRGFISTGGMIIPVSPLKASTTYTARVKVKVGKKSYTRRWSFTTAAR